MCRHNGTLIMGLSGRIKLIFYYLKVMIWKDVIGANNSLSMMQQQKNRRLKLFPLTWKEGYYSGTKLCYKLGWEENDPLGMIL